VTRYTITRYRVTDTRSIVVDIDPAEVPDGIAPEVYASAVARGIPVDLWDDAGQEVEAA